MRPPGNDGRGDHPVGDDVGVVAGSTTSGLKGCAYAASVSTATRHIKGIDVSATLSQSLAVLGVGQLLVEDDLLLSRSQHSCSQVAISWRPG